jgi:hypothetical protein
VIHSIPLLTATLDTSDRLPRFHNRIRARRHPGASRTSRLPRTTFPGSRNAAHRERAAKRQPVGACLFMDDAPELGSSPAAWRFKPKSCGQSMSASAAALGIERDDGLHRPRVEQYGVAQELLAAHEGPARNADQLRGARRSECRRRVDRDDAINQPGSSAPAQPRAKQLAELTSLLALERSGFNAHENRQVHG